jgi:hypothetical protein
MRKATNRSFSGFLARLAGKQEPEMRAVPLRPFQSVSIYRGLACCQLAKRFSEHRFLVRDAPTLPLTGCTMRETCQCRYLKHKDRRSEPRRLIDFGLSTRLFDGRERRGRGGRRSDDD